MRALSAATLTWLHCSVSFFKRFHPPVDSRFHPFSCAHPFARSTLAMNLNPPGESAGKQTWKASDVIRDALTSHFRYRRWQCESPSTFAGDTWFGVARNSPVGNVECSMEPHDGSQGSSGGRDANWRLQLQCHNVEGTMIGIHVCNFPHSNKLFH